MATRRNEDGVRVTSSVEFRSWKGVQVGGGIFEVFWRFLSRELRPSATPCQSPIANHSLPRGGEDRVKSRFAVDSRSKRRTASPKDKTEANRIDDESPESPRYLSEIGAATASIARLSVPPAFMVLQQHDGDRSTSLTLRGPSSVIGVGSGGGRHDGGRTASSHVSSRSRRYNRSHAGGSAFIPQNEFPVFSHSGDVEIIVRVASGHENRYLLHRHTLTRCSGFFEASTSVEWSRAQLVPGSPQSPPPLPGTAGAIEAAGTTTNGATGGGELARIDDRGRNSEDGAKPPLSSSMAVTPFKKRWRYELDPGTGDNDIPMLVQKEESSPAAAATATRLPASTSIFGGPAANSSSSSRHHHHHTKSSSHSFFRSVANLSLSATHTHPPALPPPTQAEQDLLRDYDNLFRIMYNYSPSLDGINIADAYVQCKSLLTLADQYDALPVVGPRVDHHLLQFQSRLWKQIAKYPISYLRLGYLARSKTIFQEALIHVVGQWPAGERSIRAALPETVLDIIEDKVDELEETISRIEARLFRLTLTNRSGERVSPATNYLDWLAVSLFRQWLADNTTPPPAPLPPPDAHRRGTAAHTSSRARGGSSSSSSGTSAAGGNTSHAHALTPIPPLASLGRTYRLLGAAPNSRETTEKGYLGHDECKRFLKLTPDLYSRDNLRRFEKRVEELKGMAREVGRRN
ncbi:hypothetical protein B0T16DRAFT_386681 [Cercophora newfieldiana]|uniref:BTB domain-containing protein n=1 Tax=Cercophora newfieldiana TaxID=92897 RepID=A0AA40CTQ5_9PEZI|nr:hypothetical protein B0T16DRAFT_386681 [Cercophora newfieldiana]